MAATPADLRTFFGLIGKTVTNVHLARFKDALEEQRYGQNPDGSPREATSDDVIDWLFRQARTFVNNHTERVARQAIEIPDTDLLGD